MERILLDDGFVRRLAKSLVQDEHGADDIAQTAWLAALRHRPTGEPHAWFAAVVKNLARSRAREGARRERREQAAAREERIPSVVELAEREATRRRVVDHVMRLDEPYRTVILLRFFEDWSPRRIASELGVPVETVKTRQKRALEKLRRALDDESHGNRAAWCLQLLPLVHAKTSVVSTITGGLLMGTKVKVAIAVVAIVVAGFAVRTATVSPSSTPPSHAAATEVASSELPDGAKLDDAAARGLITPREALEAHVATESKSADPVGLVVYGTVRNRSGKTLGDIGMRFEDASGLQLFTRTQADGVFSLHGLTAATWHVRCEATAYLTHDEDVDWGGKTGAQRLDVILDASPLIVVRIVTPDGIPIDKAIPRGTFRLTDTGNLQVVASRHSIPRPLPRSNRINGQVAGCSAFLDRREVKRRFPEMAIADDVRGVLALSRPAPVFASLLLGHVVLAEQAVASGASEVVFTISPDGFRAALADVQFQVVDASTRTPISGAHVYLNSSDMSEGIGTKTSEDGRVVLEGELAGGSRQLWIHSEGYANWTQRVDLEPGTKVDLGVVELHRPIQIHGRVVDEQGRPQAVGFVWRNLASDPLPAPLATHWMHGGSDERGKFGGSDLSPGRYLLLPVWDDASSAWALEPTWIDVLPEGTPDVNIVVHPGTDVTLRPQIDSEAVSLVVIENARGTVIFSEYLASDQLRHLWLVPGAYAWKVLADDRSVRSETFSIGSTPTTITLSR